MTSTSDHITNLTTWAAYFSSAIGEEEAKYVSLVAAEPVFYENNTSRYSDNGYALYGGISSSFDTRRSITNRQLTSLADLYWSPTYDNLTTLTNSGLVSFLERNDAFYVRRDVTLHSNTESAFRYLSNMLIVQRLVGNIRERLSRYIGTPIPSDERIGGEIESGIAESPGHKYTSYKATIDRLEGVLYLDLSTQLIGYIHEISVSVALRIS